MIYCGYDSGSYFGKVLFRFEFEFQFQFLIQTYLAQFFNNKKFVQNLAFSMLDAALFPRKSPSNFWSFDFWITAHFMLYPGPNPVPEPECITIPVPLRQKVAVLVVPVPEHWIMWLSNLARPGMWRGTARSMAWTAISSTGTAAWRRFYAIEKIESLQNCWLNSLQKSIMTTNPSPTGRCPAIIAVNWRCFSGSWVSQDCCASLAAGLVSVLLPVVVETWCCPSGSWDWKTAAPAWLLGSLVYSYLS